MQSDESLRSPATEDELAAIYRVAYGHALAGRSEEAINLCNALISHDATKLAGYRQRAAVKEYAADVDGAIQDLQALAAGASEEPSDYYALGLLLLQTGATMAAIQAFSNVISLCKAAGEDYYLNGSHLFRAEAYLRICDYKLALADVERLPVGYRTHVPGTGLRSKESIFAEATAALSQKSTFLFRK